MNNPANSKDKWDKFKIISGAVSVLLIPIILGIITYNLQALLKTKDLQLRFSELAIQILRDDPNKSSKELRLWAVNILELHSGVSLGKAKEVLINEMPFPKSWESMGLPNPEKPIAMKIKSTKGIITSKNIWEIRCRNGVRDISVGPYDYKGMTLKELPNGSVAFTAHENLTSKDKMTVVADGWGAANIEIHKNNDGVVFVVGYSEIGKITDVEFEFFPTVIPNNFHLQAVAIPLSEIIEVK
ncbi:MAG: hypothetical protein HQK55_09860 [Deltaproteobacteria bacterium]|nr:hypothetical protein [Deltaproteobacteria bacterium]